MVNSGELLDKESNTCPQHPFFTHSWPVHDATHHTVHNCFHDFVAVLASYVSQQHSNMVSTRNLLSAFSTLPTLANK
jgi:hypothetical protein